MKRLLITLFAAAILPVFAQSTNPAVKVDPKNNKVSRPVVDKPKAPLMTRDQLRACFLRQDADRVEAEAIKLAQAAQAEDRKDLLNLKNELAARGELLTTNLAKMKQDREDIIKFGEEVKARVAKEKLDKDEIKKFQDEYQARAAAMDPRIDEHNKKKDVYLADSKAFDARVAEHNLKNKTLDARAESYLDSLDAWKADCGNKAYDEADEIALKKERSAAAK